MMQQYLLIISLLCCSFALVHAEPKLCEQGACHRGSKGTCQCYCSHKCGPREWQDDDPGVYVINDPHGKGCYCKPWDKENFETSDFGKSCAIVEQEQAQEQKANESKKTNKTHRKIGKRRPVKESAPTVVEEKAD